jgi:peptidoglycan/xylan/chitin deacetylase (PgdA/CDA1 family)
MVTWRRQPIRWPNNAKIAVIPSVAFETWPQDLGLPGTHQHGLPRSCPPNAVFKRDLRTVWDRQFGERVGIYRLLELFENEGIRTTFWLNGLTVQRLPELAKEIETLGHEIACEHWIHDYAFMKSYEEERESIHKTVSSFEKTLNHHPRGYLSTGIQPTDDIPKILAEEGFLYWVDPQNEELPYTLRVGNKQLVVAGSYTGGIILNDYRVYTGAMTPADFLQVWKDNFDYLYEEGGKGRPGLMLCGLHPFVTGRPSRTMVLRQFLRHAKSFPDVWFARCYEVAEWWQKHYMDSYVEDWPNYYGALWDKSE